MKKKILSIILTLSMLCAFMPVIATAATSGTCGNNVTWTLDDNGTLTISGTGEMENYRFYSLFYNSNIKSVIIENGVTSIGDDVFESCISLTSVTIGNSVTSIGNSAFCDCSGLTSITIPDSVTSIGDSAFRDCISLTSVTIGNSVTSIDNSAFACCENLDSVYITDLVAYLNIDGYSPMGYANKLYLNGKRMTGAVTIPDSVTRIVGNAFNGCDSITSITIPDSVTSVGNSAFRGCSGITSITIPDSVTSIGDYAFSGCSGLTSIILGNGITNIDGNIFSGCSNLAKIVIPKSITEIESGQFSDCSKLTTVEYGGSQSDWEEIYIGLNNDYLKNAKINYNSPLAPTPKPTPIPTTTATVKKSETDTTYNFDVTPEVAYENCYIYATVYDENGILCAINRVPLETTGNTSVSVDKNDNAKKAKVFVFSSTLQPIITSEEFPLI